MACFSCGKSHNENEQSILAMYKENYEKTGRVVWFFKKEGTQETLIMSANDFKIFKKENSEDFKNGLYEFAHISDFRNS